MKLPIDTTGLTFMCAAEPEPVLDFDTRQQKTTESGEPLYGVRIVVLSEEGAEVVSVKVPGRPSITQGAMVNVRSLVASPWTMGDRNGVAYRASGIEAASASSRSPKTES